MRITILGGGITGLTLAWKLRQRYGQEASITLVEKSQRLGGWMQSVDHDGFLFELGPRSCRPGGHGAATLALIESLGMQDQVIHAADAAKRRFLCLDGKLTALPGSLWGCLTSPLMRPLLPKLISEWRVPKTTADESVHAFVSRRLGSAAADLLFDPLAVGIYAGDCRQLSVQSCFPQLWNWEQQHGSLTRGMFSRSSRSLASRWVQQAQRKGLFTLRGGMEALVHRLVERLEVDCLMGNRVTQADTALLNADKVYVTLPTHEAATLFGCERLASVPHATVTVVNLGYHDQQLAQSGFGYLIPTWQRESILGVVWDSCVFPQQNTRPTQTRLTVMIPGEPAQALDIALDAVQRHLGLTRQPDVHLVTVRHRAIPQYPVGYQKMLEEARRSLPPHVTLIGSGYQGVAVNDCIANALAW